MSKQKHCKSCNYFQLQDSDTAAEKSTSGFCRYNAPVASEKYSYGAQWPIVSLDDWCGKFSS
ncbi:MAG: hypothetical protein VYE27_09490 [Pseudomonadota bacterium]|nr:hypothetical protein [Pseudomonadota bacterium]